MWGKKSFGKGGPGSCLGTPPLQVAAALQVAIPHGECIVAIMHASKNATSHLLPATDDAWCGRSPHISCSPSSNLLTKLGKYSSWLLIICMVANEFSNNDSIHPSNDYFWNTCMYVYVCAGDGSEIELHNKAWPDPSCSFIQQIKKSGVLIFLYTNATAC